MDNRGPETGLDAGRIYATEWWIFAATSVSLLLLFFFPRLFRGRTEGFLHPHGFCYIWDPALVASHVTADLLIGLAYVVIAATLGYLVFRLRHLLPFHWMFLAFGLFILTCGGTHFMGVWTLWYADFWASAALKIVTGVASVATAIALPRLVPQVVRLVQNASLAETRRLQLEAEQQQRLEVEAQSQAKDLFLATLSHELRTPLNAMGGWLHVLTVDPGTAVNANSRKAIGAIQRNLALQTRLVEDMLDVSAILTGRLTLQRARLDLKEVVRRAVEMESAAMRQQPIRIEVDLPAGPVWIDGDETRLQQVLSNLISNAVKFSDEAGTVHVRLTREKDAAVLAVTDTGRGINTEFLPKVFDVFAQADQTTTRTTGGLGLGLTIVRYLVEQHGGSVSAVSTGLGHGSTFTVRLPAQVTGTE